MDTKQARALKVGDRVRWRDYDPAVHTEADCGTVTEKGFSGYKVRWDDGLEVAYRFVHSETILKVAA